MSHGAWGRVGICSLSSANCEPLTVACFKNKMSGFFIINISILSLYFNLFKINLPISIPISALTDLSLRATFNAYVTDSNVKQVTKGKHVMRHGCSIRT